MLTIHAQFANSTVTFYTSELWLVVSLNLARALYQLSVIGEVADLSRELPCCTKMVLRKLASLQEITFYSITQLDPTLMLAWAGFVYGYMDRFT